MGRKARICLKDSSAKLDELKIYLCHRVKDACRKRVWNQRVAAMQLGTTRSRMHMVDYLKIDQLTVGFLFRLLASAEPDFQILISLDMPAIRSKGDGRFKRGLNEV